MIEYITNHGLMAVPTSIETLGRKMLPRFSSLVASALVLSLLGCEGSDAEAVKKVEGERIAAETRAVAAEKALAERVALEKQLAERYAAEQRIAAEKEAATKAQIEKAERVPEKIQNDPVHSFKQLISRTQALLESKIVVVHNVPPLDLYGAPIGTDDWRRVRFKLEKTAFDVKKTDSLVWPYTATFSFILQKAWISGFPTREAAEGGHNNFGASKFPYEYEIEYAYHSGEWEPMRYLYRETKNENWRDESSHIYSDSLKTLIEQAARAKQN